MHGTDTAFNILSYKNVVFIIYFQIEAFVKGFKLSSLTYRRVMHLLNEEMNNGLHANSNYLADIKMFPTFVRSLPDGTGK